MLKMYTRPSEYQEGWSAIAYESFNGDVADTFYLRYMNCERLEENCLVWLLVEERLRVDEKSDHQLALWLAGKYRWILKDIAVKWRWGNYITPFNSVLFEYYGKGEVKSNGEKSASDDWIEPAREHAAIRPKLVKAAKADIDDLVERMLKRREQAVEEYERAKAADPVGFSEITFRFENVFKKEFEKLEGVQDRRVSDQVRQSERAQRREENKRKWREEQERKWGKRDE